MAERAINDNEVIEYDADLALIWAYLATAAEYEAQLQSRLSPERQLRHMEEVFRWHRFVFVVRPEPAMEGGYEISWVKGEMKWDFPPERWSHQLPHLRRTTAFLVHSHADVDRMLLAYGDHPGIRDWRRMFVKGRTWREEMRARVTVAGLTGGNAWRDCTPHLVDWAHDPMSHGEKSPLPLRIFDRHR